MTQSSQSSCPLTKGEHILVPFDGSPNSEVAVDQAISLGSICNSKIYLIHVIDLFPEQMVAAEDLVNKMYKEAQGFLDKAKKKIDQAGIACETEIHSGGRPHDLILKEARGKSIDLIVMGTHGASGLRRVFMGSVAQKVTGSAHCPVMVVPAIE